MWNPKRNSLKLGTTVFPFQIKIHPQYSRFDVTGIIGSVHSLLSVARYTADTDN